MSKALTFISHPHNLKASDFKSASLESSRTKISDERNAYVRNLLGNAK
jgi:hypothetical protein